jgi:hypothetical protein
MKEKRRLPGWVYKVLYSYLEHYENKYESIVATLEIVLIAYGLAVSLRELARGGVTFATVQMAFESAEFVVFLLLLLTALSRFLVSIRLSKLGYAYDRLVQRLGSSDDPDAFPRFQHLIETADLGHAPGLLAARFPDAQVLADKIAVQTASFLSMRSWFFMDRRWQGRERDALAAWFKEFPSALWVIPEASGVERESLVKSSGWHTLSHGGYVSVIVPMTRHSGRSIRNGQRATDLAELDLGVVERFDASGIRTGGEVSQVDLLAYLHIHVPAPGGSRQRSETRLLAGSIQHLAFLLHGLYGANDDAMDKWNFSVLCESSNRGMNTVLQRLGFARLDREADGSKTQRNEARSYAGFTLFELSVSRGHCDIADGRLFLEMLHNTVNRFATQQRANIAA